MQFTNTAINPSASAESRDESVTDSLKTGTGEFVVTSSSVHLDRLPGAEDAMVSALLENKTMGFDLSTEILMDVEVRKTPAEWQAHFLSLHTSADDINFQSQGHVKPWFGDFMHPGVKHKSKIGLEGALYNSLLCCRGHGPAIES